MQQNRFSFSKEKISTRKISWEIFEKSWRGASKENPLPQAKKTLFKNALPIYLIWMNPKAENPSAEQNWAGRLPRANLKKEILELDKQ